MKLTIRVVVLVQLLASFLADPIPEQQKLPQCVDSHFAVTADNKLELYLDGHQVTSGLPNADKWTVADSVSVSATTRVIAIKGVNNNLIPVAGILGSGAFSTTDGSWKCTNELHEGWAAKGFDGSDWPAATVLGSHGDHPWKIISGISSDAKWIWTEKLQNEDSLNKTIYCRKRRGCTYDPTDTGSSCIRSCDGKADEDYQYCKRCDGYASCSNGNMYDERPRAPGCLIWNDKLKRCEWKSSRCGIGTNERRGKRSSCIKSCAGRVDGDYQSCKGCRVYATCSNGHLFDQRLCPSGLAWDDNRKRCERKSTTCGAGIYERPGTGSSCITSCVGRIDGDYQSCKRCDAYATCSNGFLYDQRPCRRGLVWDDKRKRCEWNSSTCT